ncbi:MAG: hypothetical protein E7543_01075 [Ruminococcaceae bacterium]|nr:hypothetical protein [Oscillospiraceae bacterium]
MKKLIFVLIFTLFLSVLSFNVSATEATEDDLSQKLFDGIDVEVWDILEDFGITSFDSESVYNISFSSILEYYKDSLSEYLKGTLSLFTRVFSLILLGGITSLVINTKKYKDILSVLLVPIVTVILTDEIRLCINSALSLLKLNGNFMLVFVPIYAVAVSVAGNPAAAVTYNTFVLGFSEVISAGINYGLVDIIGCFFCLCIGFSLNRFINFPRFLSAVNRLISFVFGLVSSLFTSFLSLKGIFAASTDSVAAKGIKFAIGSLIPVIGSSISDAYSTLIGSFGVLKNSVAIVGIFVMLALNFPVIAETVIFNIALNTLSFISELFDCDELSNVLRAFACGIKIIGLLVLSEMLILIISTAIMLTVKGG